MLVVVDNKMGNIKSVSRALDFIGAPHKISADPSDLENCSKIIFPGVGNFYEASHRLEANGLKKVIRKEVLENKKTILGICLGMQLLFEKGQEGGESEGLNLIPGLVCPLKDSIPDKIIPHMGWNELQPNGGVLIQENKEGDCFYFVHSFEVLTNDQFVSSYTDYGKKIVASVEKDNIYGTQFHPEKSQELGINMLKRFIEVC